MRGMLVMMGLLLPMAAQAGMMTDMRDVEILTNDGDTGTNQWSAAGWVSAEVENDLRYVTWACSQVSGPTVGPDDIKVKITQAEFIETNPAPPPAGPPGPPSGPPGPPPAVAGVWVQKLFVGVTDRAPVPGAAICEVRNGGVLGVSHLNWDKAPPEVPTPPTPPSP